MFKVNNCITFIAALRSKSAIYNTRMYYIHSTFKAKGLGEWLSHPLNPLRHKQLDANCVGRLLPWGALSTVEDPAVLCCIVGLKEQQCVLLCHKLCRR